MVMFDIEIQLKEDQGDFLSTMTAIPRFEPNIASVVTFGDVDERKFVKIPEYNSTPNQQRRRPNPAQKRYMRRQTQILLMQNYEKVKQAMLSGSDTEKAIFIQKFMIRDLSQNPSD